MIFCVNIIPEVYQWYLQFFKVFDNSAYNCYRYKLQRFYKCIC